MKTTGAPESKKTSPDPKSAAESEGTSAADDLDPGFTIEGTGGPSDSSGGSHTGPVSPPRQ